MTLTILEDTREILSIESFSSDTDVDGSESRVRCVVGSFGITKIEAYAEPGMHCDLPYFAVYKGGEILARLPAIEVTVFYAISPPPERTEP